MLCEAVEIQGVYHKIPLPTIDVVRDSAGRRLSHQYIKTVIIDITVGVGG
jgi:hypothetical protein